jgi:two-component system, sensor histidine kinase and response regulator
MTTQQILLVEDDHALLRGVTDLLEMAGYIVSQATDGQAALNLLEGMAESPDLIVSDIGMPNLDGFEFLAAVRARARWLTIPFIFMTAKDDKEDIRNGKLSGADDYITKPFEFKDLLVSVQSALNRREQLNALQASEMETLRQQILKVLNHEFRTPLSYIVAYSDLMANSPSFKHSAELRQYIDGITEGSERLSNLIESFLTLAELESGRSAQIYESRKTLIADVRLMLEQIIESLKKQAIKSDVNIHFAAETSVPPIMGDSTYLELAVHHLIENAIKFSPKGEGANVTISLLADSQNIVVAVCDQGRGIPLSEHQRLFEMFYQVNRNHYEQQGTGAGLAIAQQVAHLHGGQIIVQSELGIGSCFLLSLPIHSG